MIYYFRHFLLYRTFSDIGGMYPIRQNENPMYFIRQVCILFDIACIISDMHVLYPTITYYIRQACIISDRRVLYPTLPVLYPTGMCYIRKACTKSDIGCNISKRYVLYPTINCYIQQLAILTSFQKRRSIIIYYSLEKYFFSLYKDILPLFFLPLIFF